MTNSTAFIDNGQIKIVDSTGNEFSEVIDGSTKYIFQLNFMFVIFIFTAFTFWSLAFSNVVVNWMDSSQIFWSVIFGIIMSFASGVSFTAKMYMFNTRETQQADFNLSKRALQAEVLQLQQILAEHNSKLERITLKNKFNFKKENNLEITG